MTTSNTLAQNASEVEVRSEISSSSLRIEGKSIRRWGLQSAVALLDQGFTSGAGFLINLLLARWLPPTVYGGFAVAFASGLFLSGFHNVLLLEPMSVLGPSRYRGNLMPYFRAQLGIHFLFVGGLSLVGFITAVGFWLVSPNSTIASDLLGVALALPFFLFLWLVRRMCYVAMRPALALYGSSVYLAIIVFGLAGLRYAHRLNPLNSFILMGAGGALAAAWLFFKLGRIEQEPAGLEVSFRTVFRENWEYGRWLLGSAVLYSVCNQIQLFLVAGTIGLNGAGVLRAMQLPALVMTQVVTAIGLLVLPSFAYDFGFGFFSKMRQRAWIVSGGLFSLASCFAGLLWIVERPTQDLLFQGNYSQFSWLMPLLAVVPAANAIGLGFSMALRASRKPQFDLVGNIVAAPIAILTAYFFVRGWGLAGAACSMILSFSVTSAVTYFFYMRWQKGRSFDGPSRPASPEQSYASVA